MFVIVLMIMLLIGVVHAGIRLAWGMGKFLFGLGLFWVCPLLFIVAVPFGAFSHMWLPIIIPGILMERGYRKA